MTARGGAVRRPRGGQASLEALAVVPAIVLAAMLAWWLAGVAAAGVRAEDDVRRAALRAEGPPGTVATVRVRVTAPVPWTSGLVLEPAAAVRLP